MQISTVRSGVKIKSSDDLGTEVPQVVAVEEKKPETDAEKADYMREMGFLNANEIEAKAVVWVWPPYIPAAMLSSIEGDPGIGKSFATCKIAYHVTTGTPFPGHESKGRSPPGRVLMLSGEDSPAYTLVPRLERLGCDMKRVHFAPDGFNFGPGQLQHLRKMMRSMELTVIFIDPIQHYMGGDIDINKANEVRTFLSQLNAIAAETGCAIVIVRHLRKAGGGTKIYRGLGSIDFVAACRSGLQVTREQGSEYATIEHVKCNVGPIGPSISYVLKDDNFEWNGEVETPTGRKKKPKAGEGQQRVAIEFIQDFLKDGPQPAKDVQKAAIEKEISLPTLLKVREQVAKSYKNGLAWVWELIVEGVHGDGE